jgi:hypothetical protein
VFALVWQLAFALSAMNYPDWVDDVFSAIRQNPSGLAAAAPFGAAIGPLWLNPIARRRAQRDPQEAKATWRKGNGVHGEAV